MAYTIWDKTFDDYIRNHYGDDASNWDNQQYRKEAEDAAWNSYWGAGAGWRDKDYNSDNYWGDTGYSNENAFNTYIKQETPKIENVRKKQKEIAGSDDEQDFVWKQYGDNKEGVYNDIDKYVSMKDQLNRQFINPYGFINDNSTAKQKEVKDTAKRIYDLGIENIKQGDLDWKSLANKVKKSEDQLYKMNTPTGPVYGLTEGSKKGYKGHGDVLTPVLNQQDNEWGKGEEQRNQEILNSLNSVITSHALDADVNAENLNSYPTEWRWLEAKMKNDNSGNDKSRDNAWYRTWDVHDKLSKDYLQRQYGIKDIDEMRSYDVDVDEATNKDKKTGKQIKTTNDGKRFVDLDRNGVSAEQMWNEAHRSADDDLYGTLDEDLRTTILDDIANASDYKDYMSFMNASDPNARPKMTSTFKYLSLDPDVVEQNLTAEEKAANKKIGKRDDGRVYGQDFISRAYKIDPRTGNMRDSAVGANNVNNYLQETVYNNPRDLVAMLNTNPETVKKWLGGNSDYLHQANADIVWNATNGLGENNLPSVLKREIALNLAKKNGGLTDDLIKSINKAKGSDIVKSASMSENGEDYNKGMDEAVAILDTYLNLADASRGDKSSAAYLNPDNYVNNDLRQYVAEVNNAKQENLNKYMNYIESPKDRTINPTDFSYNLGNFSYDDGADNYAPVDLSNLYDMNQLLIDKDTHKLKKPIAGGFNQNVVNQILANLRSTKKKKARA